MISLFKKLHCGNKSRVANTPQEGVQNMLYKKSNENVVGFFVCFLSGLILLRILQVFSCRVEVLVVLGQQDVHLAAEPRSAGKTR